MPLCSQIVKSPSWSAEELISCTWPAPAMTHLSSKEYYLPDPQKVFLSQFVPGKVEILREGIYPVAFHCLRHLDDFSIGSSRDQIPPPLDERGPRRIS